MLLKPSINLHKIESKFIQIIEEYLYTPSFIGILIAILLSPISILYCLISGARILLLKRVSFDIPIVSVGNLTLGGNGKTPFIMAIARRYSDYAIILRGYGRESRGTLVVSKDGEIFKEIREVGDEAFEYANSLKNSIIIVSEDRKEGIRQAIELGAKIVFLDDGFRHNIDKFDILLRGSKEPLLPLCIPSSGYRESPLFYLKSDLVLKEGVDYKRSVKVPDIKEKVLFVSAIARAKRVLEYIDKNLIAGTYIQKDHAYFDEADIKKEMKRVGVDLILTTNKDFMKMGGFGINIAVINVDIEIDAKVLNKVDFYILHNRKTEDHIGSLWKTVK